MRALSHQRNLTMLRAVLAAALIVSPSLAGAQASSAPQRIRSVQLTKGQPCPKAVGDEVVVCSTIEDPYRIPKPLRDAVTPSAAKQSWVNRAATLDQVGREAGGLPDTCSPVGTGGQSGCALLINQRYAAEKRAKADGDATGR